MAKFHRILDAQTGEMEVRQFTAEEETRADAIEAEIAQRIASRQPPITLEDLDARLKILEAKQ